MIKRNYVRVLSPLLALLVFVSALAAPVSAAEDTFMEVLNYDQVSDYGNFFYYTGNTTISLSLPYETQLSYVDIVFRASFAPDTVTVTWGSSRSWELDLISIGSGLYRAYGIVNANFRTLPIVFDNSLTHTSAVNYVTLLSCEVGNLIKSYFTQTAGAVVTVPDASVREVLSFEGSPVSYSGQPKQYTSFTFDFYVPPEDWVKYDYIEFYCTFVCSSITTVLAQINGTNIPVSVTWLVPDSSSEIPVEGATVPNATTAYGAFFMLDLTGLKRSDYLNDSTPVLTVIGDTAQNGYLSLNFIDCTGVVSVEPLSPFAAFFQDLKTSITSNFNTLSGKLSGWFSDLISAVKGDQTAADEFQQAVEDQAGDLDQMGDVFDSVTRPMLDDVQVDVGGYVTDSDISEVTSLAGLLLDHTFFQRMIIMSLIMATAGYVLFGKR